jgi:uncharacterized RDD family membrane protein YckC
MSGTAKLDMVSLMAQPAGVGRRLAAYTIDIIPISFAVLALFYFFFGFDRTLAAYFSDSRSTDDRIRFLIERNRIRDLSFVVWLIYSAVMEASALQGTLGKRLLGLRVVDANGGRITLGRSIRRNLTKILSYVSLGIGFFWAAFSKQKRTWHDMLSATTVVYGKSEAATPVPAGSERRDRHEVSALPLLALADYRKAIAHIPAPTESQITEFARYAAEAKSWYKHLPLLPPGVPFTFYIDPWAGLDRILEDRGGMVFLQRTEQSPKFHYTWMTTEAYRDRFGRLAFACPAGTALFPSVGVELQNGRKVKGVFDNNPCRASIHLSEIAEYRLPPEVMESGTVAIAGLVHKTASQPALWKSVVEQESLLLRWPARSGGTKTGRAIADLVRAHSAGKMDGDDAGRAMEELLRPARERMREDMVQAMNRMVATLYGRPA